MSVKLRREVPQRRWEPEDDLRLYLKLICAIVIVAMLVLETGGLR
jgi:hypothetical protein